MKTSVSQFEMLVNFIENHDDINKPTKNAEGKIQTIQAWETLTSLLNGDATGETKTTEKWKKVWSDLKNNTKKKAAKINRAAGATGGGPALHIHLTELEERVLNIIGTQAATGLMEVSEAGLPKEQNVTQDNRTTLSATPPRIVVEIDSPSIFDYAEIGEIEISEGSNVRNIPTSPEMHKPVYDAWNISGMSQQPHALQTQPPAQGNLSPTHGLPAQRGHTPRRRRGSPLRRARSPRRRFVAQHSYIEQATQHSNEEWRNFLKKKHNDEVQIEREKLHIREKEIEAQLRWQEVAMSAIAAFNKIIDSRLLRD